MSDFTNPMTESQRVQFDAQQTYQMEKWVEQQVWDLCDDITGRGCTTLGKLSDGEIAAYARGVRNTLNSVLERFRCKDFPIQTLIDGALGERHHRRSGHGQTGYHRRLFGNLAWEIRELRVAMLDSFVTFDYPKWETWRKRVWAIERKGVERGEWEEFELLQHELNALSSLSSWLVKSDYWRDKNWEWRKSQEVKEAA